MTREDRWVVIRLDCGSSSGFGQVWFERTGFDRSQVKLSRVDRLTTSRVSFCIGRISPNIVLRISFGEPNTFFCCSVLTPSIFFVMF